MSVVTLHAWRHPKTRATPGLCLGRTDVPVDPRKAKRLAHRIRTFARRNGLPRIVVTSPLSRCRDVGRWLARCGWRHEVDADLLELDFGSWDGRNWDSIPRHEVNAWCADFVDHAAGGGESVASLLQRVRRFSPGHARLVVTHGGWLSAARWLATNETAPPDFTRWPPAPIYGERVSLEASPQRAELEA